MVCCPDYVPPNPTLFIFSVISVAEAVHLEDLVST